MKRCLLVIFVFVILLASCATSGEKLTERLTYAEIIEISGTAQVDLYTKANMWFVDVFRNAESVIQFSDRDSGVIMGKYINRGLTSGIYFFEITTTITVEIRDERCRISFTDPIYQYIGDALNGTYARPGASGPVETVAMAGKIQEEWLILAESLKNSLLSNSGNW